MSGKGKKKAPDTRHVAKVISPPPQLVPTDELPHNLGFLWSIDALQIIDNGKHPQRILGVGRSKGNDVVRLWFPPNQKAHFRRIDGNLYRWRMGDSERVHRRERPEKKYAVASVFFQPRQDNFLVTNKDCTQHDIEKEELGWCHIGFYHEEGGLSAVDICGTEFKLAAPANGSSWMPQILPEVYNYDSRGPVPKHYSGPPGGLCGKLALLIGMAAFSADVDRAEAVVEKCFKLGKWLHHQRETGVEETGIGRT